MKVIIIGAGIAGLAAGIYAQQSGIEATIFEAHSIAGGNATSWRRKGYLFEGGLHWLVGSSKKTALHELWCEVGALQENNPVHNRDPFFSYISKKGTISLYRDSKKMEESLLSISPQDEKAIRQLGKDIRSFLKMSMPIMDLKGVKVKTKRKMALSTLFSFVSSMNTMKQLSNISVAEYIARFKGTEVRELLALVVGSKEFTANSLLFTLGGFAAGDGGYPKGGSLRMAQNMEDKFKEWGGNLQFQKRVEQIHISNGKADGVLVDGELHQADAVIVTQDTLSAVDLLFKKPLNESWILELKKNITPINCTFLSLGIAADLKHIPANVMYPIKKSFSYGGKTHHTIAFNNYANFKNYAPKGCSALTMILMEDTYDEWKAAKLDGTYNQKKQELAEIIIDRLTSVIPEIENKVEVWDIATPLTYERYCGTYRGSWMSIMKPGDSIQQYPCRSESVRGLYFAGQRICLPGGMPVALTTGRTAVQHVCLDQNIMFQQKM